MVSEARHYNMSRIRAKDTSIELLLRHALWARGLRYRKYVKDLPGKPDIVFTKHKIAVFCDGEFFHGKDWDNLKETLQKGNNPDFWISKIARNMERDRKNDTDLAAMGWTVIRFWGKTIKRETEECIARIEEEIRKKQNIQINQTEPDTYEVTRNGITEGTITLNKSELTIAIDDQETARSAISYVITEAHRRKITEISVIKENTNHTKLLNIMDFHQEEEIFLRNRKI